MAQDASRLASRRPQELLISIYKTSETVDFHATVGIFMVSAWFWPHDEVKIAQDDVKMAQDELKMAQDGSR